MDTFRDSKRRWVRSLADKLNTGLPIRSGDVGARPQLIALATVLACFGPMAASAQDADELAKKLSNPISSLISVPFQYNADFGIGTDGDGVSQTLNIQPVIPFSVNEDWNVISRTIVPVKWQANVSPRYVFGLGDTTQSLFLSPKAPGPGGLIWGVGPVFSIPTATDKDLGSGQFGIGPTAVALVQKERWTLGALANHVWSLDENSEVNSSFVQPFVAYALGNGQTLTLNTETSYNWSTEQAVVPINAQYTKVLRLGEQPISLQVGGRVYANRPKGGPDWGVRSALTFLFPR